MHIAPIALKQMLKHFGWQNGAIGAQRTNQGPHWAGYARKVASVSKMRRYLTRSIDVYQNDTRSGQVDIANYAKNARKSLFFRKSYELSNRMVCWHSSCDSKQDFAGRWTYVFVCLPI